MTELFLPAEARSSYSDDLAEDAWVIARALEQVAKEQHARDDDDAGQAASPRAPE